MRRRKRQLALPRAIASLKKLTDQRPSFGPPEGQLLPRVDPELEMNRRPIFCNSSDLPSLG
jgi:hypothetical protein